MKRKVLFIDRDGTIIVEPPEDFQIDSLEKLRFCPQAITYLSRIALECDFDLVMVTNQDGMGTASFPAADFWPAHNKMMTILADEGIQFADVYIDPSLPEDNSPNRKPGTGMLSKYIFGNYDLADSFVIGDRESDMMLAKNLGCKGLYYHQKTQSDQADVNFSSWSDIYQYLKGQPRQGHVIRKTNETDITVNINLDGTGRSDINTGLGFFDHMLEQISRHSHMDLQIQVNGDLHIDEHHTIEDTALALGQCVKEALGSKKGIERYSFVLPMDDCLAQVALDFGGRPWLVWEVDFQREKIGEMPTEMFYHFFKSFCDTAGTNINIKAEGSNEHHKIESIFKSFGRAIGKAVVKDAYYQIPSTKGVL